jgi:hypothetical protein
MHTQAYLKSMTSCSPRSIRLLICIVLQYKCVRQATTNKRLAQVIHYRVGAECSNNDSYACSQGGRISPFLARLSPLGAGDDLAVRQGGARHHVAALAADAEDQLQRQ